MLNTILVAVISTPSATVDTPFDDWTIQAAIQYGTGASSSGVVGQTTLQLGTHVPIYGGFGLRTGATVDFFRDHSDDGIGALASVGGGLHYTIDLGRRRLFTAEGHWGIGLTAGASYVPWGVVVDNDVTEFTAVRPFQEASFRYATKIVIVTAGAHSSQLIGSYQNYNFGLFLRVAFRLL